MHFQFRHTWLIAITLSAALCGCTRSGSNVQAAREETAKNAALTPAGKDFIRTAEEDAIKQRNLARVAVQKSTNDSVRDYAQNVADHRTDDLNRLVDIMKKNQMPQPDALPEVKHEALDKLNGLSGPEFDREFINVMITDHQRIINAYQQAQNTIQDKNVKDYIDDALSTLKKELDQAQKLQQESSV